MTDNFKPVRSMRDLKQFGITGLTGEACAFGMRMLCDVNEEGRALLEEYFGIPGLALAKNYNSTVDGKPAIGSIMLAHDMVKKLAQFAFFRAQVLAVAISPTEVIGIYSEEYLERYRNLAEGGPENGPKYYSICVNHARRSTAPMVGSRNVHQFTGRAI